MSAQYHFDPDTYVRPTTAGLFCSNRTARIDPDRLVLYPELIYRRYESDRLVEEIVHLVTMRCYYPEEFEAQIVDRGFRVTNRWGGYGHEEYGEGPELVIEFAPQAG